MAKNKDKGAVTTDKRFSGVHNDPRFNLPKRNDFKVEIDDRFKESDLEGLKRKAKVDKYGRKIPKGETSSALNKYYKSKENKKNFKLVSSEETGINDGNEDEDDHEEDDEDEDEEDEESDNSSIEDEHTEFDGQVSTQPDLARGEGVIADYESSSDESSSDEESEVEEESDIEEEEKPPQGDPSTTFAVVNMDWDHVKSVDLMATFQSFVPSGGHIVSVSIYPSEYGKERMQQEEIEGPPRDIFKKKKKRNDSDSDSEIEAKDLYEEGNSEKDYDSKSLRKYQLQRLRYFYAIVVCDSIASAKSICDNCDGTEYESTANFFDLRYVPGGMEFDDEARDSCTKVPSNYKPLEFVTDALQSSNVKLTWDETPAERVQLSKKSFSRKEIDDMDFKAYLASDNSDEEDEDDLKNKYKTLAGASTKIGDKDIFDGDDGDEGDVDMEITFTPGLDDAIKEGGSDAEEESTIDKLKRKAKERRKLRKQKLKELKKEAQAKKNGRNDKKVAKREQTTETEKSKAELELLMLDEDKNDKNDHFDLKEILRSEKEQKKKSKHRNKDKILKDNFEADLSDPRFAEVFTNHEFAIDPTQPQFKKTSTMQKILDERNKRRKEDDADAHKKQERQKKRKTQDSRKSEDVHALVEKLKRKNKRK